MKSHTVEVDHGGGFVKSLSLEIPVPGLHQEHVFGGSQVGGFVNYGVCG